MEIAAAAADNQYCRYLTRRAGQIASIYLAQVRPRALLLTGSTVKGDCDEYSDIDLITYYDALPSTRNCKACARWSWACWRPLGPRSDDSLLDSFTVDGIECQVGHLLVARVEHDIARVLDAYEVDPQLHKSLIGLRDGLALQDDGLVAGWQARLASFPDELARAMVAHYLGQIFAPWYFQQSLARRDTVLWQQQLLVDCAQGLLGALAGLNRRFFSTFQFKRMRPCRSRRCRWRRSIWPGASRSCSSCPGRRRSSTPRH